ncbi:MAG: hypothetical protein ACK4K7_06940 [Allosphingosinicella sp.]
MQYRPVLETPRPDANPAIEVPPPVQGFLYGILFSLLLWMLIGAAVLLVI